jgi:hypothetical protein
LKLSDILGFGLSAKFAGGAKKSLSVILLLSCFTVFAGAQKTLVPENEKATVGKVFKPVKKTDADFYLIRFRIKQLVGLSVVSKSTFLSAENECGVYFRLFDGRGKEVWLGDAPAGIDRWLGEIKESGLYKIRVSMQCVESFTTAELLRKKPKFKYVLEITGTKMATR